MMEARFYEGKEILGKLDEIAPVFIAAFAGEPWNEVSACADSLEIPRCPGGLSSLAIGEYCNDCQSSPSKPAYEASELAQDFADSVDTLPTVWYTEETEQGIVLAGFACLETRHDLSRHTYKTAPLMGEWMGELFGDKKLVWIHEIFADRKKRASGNLDNFGAMCSGLLDRLGGNILGFCTINPRMCAATIREFGNKARVFQRQSEVPDRRDFVFVDLDI